MDPHFTFPRRLNSNRESDALRASVLDAALLLGVGTNEKVTNWMFNNPLLEEDEEENLSPGLTSGSTATSEDSFNNPDLTPIQLTPPPPSFTNPIPDILSFDPNALPDKLSRNKLRKRRGTDDYDSDGGYISESRSRQKSKSSEDESAKEKKKLEKERAKEEKERKKKERKAAKQKQKQNPKSPDTDYDTDDGSVKLKKSRSFFRLSSKSSQAKLSQEPTVVPPVPTLPALPIAGKFASTIPPFPSPSETVVPLPNTSIELDPGESTESESSNANHTLSLPFLPPTRKPIPRPLAIPPAPTLNSPYVIVSSSNPLDTFAHSNQSSDIVPSTDFIVPSPSVLAHYDLPPPSPPPTGPLPRLPPSAIEFNPRRPSPILPPSRPTPLSNSITAESPQQQQRARGRQAPFPMPRPQPIGAVGPGLESQLRVPRYRDLYVIGSPGGGWKTSAPTAPRIWEDGQKWVNDHPEEPSQEDEDQDDLRDVLDRFRDEEEPAQHDKAVPTRHSFRDLGGAAALVDSDESVYADHEEEDDDERTTTDPRISRHSEASGRLSILDGERSEAVRARFIRRVEAMIDSENERGPESARSREPPVPKIPDGFRKGPSSHIRF